MVPYEIPLSPRPQTFSVSLARVSYKMTVQWCTAARCWILDILTLDEIPLLLGLPMVTGVDLLGQHRHIGIGGGLAVQSDVDLNEVPTFESLGVHGHLYFLAD